LPNIFLGTKVDILKAEAVFHKIGVINHIGLERFQSDTAFACSRKEVQSAATAHRVANKANIDRREPHGYRIVSDM
jgi:hypothetical protein